MFDVPFDNIHEPPASNMFDTLSDNIHALNSKCLMLTKLIGYVFKTVNGPIGLNGEYVVHHAMADIKVVSARVVPHPLATAAGNVVDQDLREEDAILSLAQVIQTNFRQYRQKLSLAQGGGHGGSRTPQNILVRYFKVSVYYVCPLPDFRLSLRP